MRLRPFVLVLALAFVVVSCGDDGGDDDAVPGDATTNDGSSAPADASETTGPDAESTTTTTTTSTATTTTSTTPPPPDPYDGYVTDVYDDPAVWICWPGADDVCAENQDLTLVAADGSLEVVPFAAADDAPVDCFYVYPTVSQDPTASSDLVPGEAEEIVTTRSQAARYGSVCNVYAPVYRQNTLASLLGGVAAPEGVDTREVAYRDVLDAWKHYVSTASDGRGFVLLGHSQGAGMLRRLIAEEIDGVPELQERLVAAHILGASVAPGADGSFATIPDCRALDQIGCVVSYATFRDTAPPPSNSFFGRASNGPALCVNPAAPEGGSATLRPEFLFDGGTALMSGSGPLVDQAAAAAITTPWVGYPDFVTGACVDDGTFGYLSIEVLGDPTDPRADDISGDLTPEWGMHLVDAQVALGDLVAMVEAQVAAYLG